jgi:ketosteroid isomerase-like protein
MEMPRSVENGQGGDRCPAGYQTGLSPPCVPKPCGGSKVAHSVLREWTAAFDAFRVEADHFLDAGDRLIVFVRNAGRLKESGMSIENRFVHVWTVRNGRGIRLEGYLDEDKALEAAGLR